MLLKLVMLQLFKVKQDVENLLRSLSIYLSQDGVMEEDVLFAHKYFYIFLDWWYSRDELLHCQSQNA